MGLNLNYTKEDGQQADYWKISRVENWFQGTTGPQYAANVNTLGFTNETYRDQGAPSVDGNMYSCPYSGARDYYPYVDATGGFWTSNWSTTRWSSTTIRLGLG